MITLIMTAAAVIAAGAGMTTGGVARADQVEVRISDASITTLRLAEGDAVLDLSIADPSLVEVQFLSDRMIAVSGNPGSSGVHMLLRRSDRAPLDVHLVPAGADASSKVVDVDGVSGTASATVRRWDVAGKRVSQLSPGFPIRSVLRTGAAQVTGLSDGSFAATGTTGDVVVYGEHDEVAVYSMR